MKSNDWAHIYLEEVRVPAKNIIGDEGKGFYYQMQQVMSLISSKGKYCGGPVIGCFFPIVPRRAACSGSWHFEDV